MESGRGDALVLKEGLHDLPVGTLAGLVRVYRVRRVHLPRFDADLPGPASPAAGREASDLTGLRDVARAGGVDGP